MVHRENLKTNNNYKNKYGKWVKLRVHRWKRTDVEKIPNIIINNNEKLK